MAGRRFVKPESISSQLALPVGRAARAKNRQAAEKAAGLPIRRRPGRPEKLVKSPHAVTHQPRPKLKKDEVLHLTMKLKRGLPSLRRRRTFAVIQKSFFKYSQSQGFRMVQFSVQHDHLHLIAEVDSKGNLSKGVQRLATSLAKRLGFVWEHKGRVFKERYHQHVLKTPREVRNALLYVLKNGVRHHASRAEERDVYSSAPYFDGYAGCDGYAKGNAKSPPEGLLARATSWLLTKGWRKFGLVKGHERPADEMN